jgi:hypothetical protein
LLVTLDDAMERIRALSRELSPPARSAPESATKKATIV